MKISCNIIRDLLPLYAEEMTSPDSNAMVEEHLTDCAECTDFLKQLKQETPMSVETDTQSLTHLKKTIVRRRGLSILAAIFTLLTLAALVITYLFTPFQLTAEEALDDFYVRDDGAIVIDYSSAVFGRMRSGHNENWYLIQSSSRYDRWYGEHRDTIEEMYGEDGQITEMERQLYENIDVVRGRWERPDGTSVEADPYFVPEGEGWVFTPESERWNWWYMDPNGFGNHTLLHDAGKGEGRTGYDFSPVYPLVFFGSLIGAAALWLGRKYGKKQWLKELFMRGIILCGSLAFSTLFVSNGRIFTCTVGIIDQFWGILIPMNTVPLTLTVLFWRQLHLLNKQDKAQ